MLTFFIGVLSGFCLALPVGAVALMCINKTLQFGFKSGLAVGLGAAFADAFYAPVVTRLMSYALPVSDATQQYMQTMMQHPAMQAWVTAALQEQAWVNYLEPYQPHAL